MATEPAIALPARPAARGLAVDHVCAWCRSWRVTAVLELADGRRPPERLAGRCADCRRDVDLVPARFVC